MLVSVKIVDGFEEGVSEKVILDDSLLLVRSREGIVLFVHVVNDIHKLLLHTHTKNATHPHAMKATKCLRNRLFYYLGLMHLLL